jgi:hypothetical protein
MRLPAGKWLYAIALPKPGKDDLGRDEPPGVGIGNAW